MVDLVGTGDYRLGKGVVSGEEPLPHSGLACWVAGRERADKPVNAAKPPNRVAAVRAHAQLVRRDHGRRQAHECGARRPG
jgi:hypothetical protein